MRYLIQTKIKADGNIWSFKPVNGKGELPFSLQASEDQIRTLFRKLKVKDDISQPRSNKGLTYQQMMDEIKSGRDNLVYIWSNYYPKSVEDARKLIN